MKSNMKPWKLVVFFVLVLITLGFTYMGITFQNGWWILATVVMAFITIFSPAWLKYENAHTPEDSSD